MKPDLGAAALSYPTGVRGLSAPGIPIPVRNEYYNREDRSWDYSGGQRLKRTRPPCRSQGTDSKGSRIGRVSAQLLRSLC